MMPVSILNLHPAAKAISVLGVRQGVALYFTFVIVMTAIKSWSAALKVAVKR